LWVPMPLKRPKSSGPAEPAPTEPRAASSLPLVVFAASLGLLVLGITITHPLSNWRAGVETAPQPKAAAPSKGALAPVEPAGLMTWLASSIGAETAPQPEGASPKLPARLTDEAGEASLMPSEGTLEVPAELVAWFAPLSSLLASASAPVETEITSSQAEAMHSAASQPVEPTAPTRVRSAAAATLAHALLIFDSLALSEFPVALGAAAVAGLAALLSLFLCSQRKKIDTSSTCVGRQLNSSMDSLKRDTETELTQYASVRAELAGARGEAEVARAESKALRVAVEGKVADMAEMHAEIARLLVVASSGASCARSVAADGEEAPSVGSEQQDLDTLERVRVALAEALAKLAAEKVEAAEAKVKEVEHSMAEMMSRIAELSVQADAAFSQARGQTFNMTLAEAKASQFALELEDARAAFVPFFANLNVNDIPATVAVAELVTQLGKELISERVNARAAVEKSNSLNTDLEAALAGAVSTQARAEEAEARAKEADVLRAEVKAAAEAVVETAAAIAKLEAKIDAMTVAKEDATKRGAEALAAAQATVEEVKSHLAAEIAAKAIVESDRVHLSDKIKFCKSALQQMGSAKPEAMPLLQNTIANCFDLELASIEQLQSSKFVSKASPLPAHSHIDAVETSSPRLLRGMSTGLGSVAASARAMSSGVSSGVAKFGSPVTKMFSPTPIRASTSQAPLASSAHASVRTSRNDTDEGALTPKHGTPVLTRAHSTASNGSVAMASCADSGLVEVATGETDGAPASDNGTGSWLPTPL